VFRCAVHIFESFRIILSSTAAVVESGFEDAELGNRRAEVAAEGEQRFAEEGSVSPVSSTIIEIDSNSNIAMTSRSHSSAPTGNDKVSADSAHKGGKADSGSSTSKLFKLIIGAGGIYAAFLYYGTLQEDVFDYKAANGTAFKAAWFLQALGKNAIYFEVDMRLNYML
jgi:hypothetical protein